MKRARRFLSLFVLLALCLGAMLPCAHAEKAGAPIRVGCFPLNGFYDFASDGTMSGYGAEYTDTVFSYSHWDFEYVRFSSWVEALDALSKSEIDLLAPAQHTPEREAVFTFDTFPIGTEYGALVSLSTNDALVYEDYAAFDGLHVGCVKSLIFLDDFKDYEARNGFSVNLAYYKDTEALVAALNAGEVEAILVNMMVKTASMKLLARFGAAPIYYMLSPAAADLHEELNLVIDEISSSHPQLQNELSAKYFSGFDQLPFSREEYDYIAGCGVLKAACGADYAPFSYIDSETGQISGVDRALLEQISAISGLKFSYEPIPFGSSTDSFIESRGIALLAGVEHDENSHQHGSRFTEAYLTVPKFFVGLEGSAFDFDGEKTVAVVNAADLRPREWEERYPGFSFLRCSSARECAEAVRSGKADYLLENRYSIENLLSAPQNEDFQLFPSEAVSSGICFKVTGTGDEAMLLTSILNKSIRQLSATETERIVSEYAQKTRYQYSAADFIYRYRVQIVFASIVLAVILTALFFVLRARRRSRREIAESEMKLRNITNNINGGVVVLKTGEGLNITYANDGFLELIGCTREEFEQQGNGSYLAYVHPGDLDKVQEALASGQGQLSIELRIQHSCGAYVPTLFNCTVGQEKDGGRELYCVILDMSEQVRLLEQLRIDKRRTDLILERVDEIFYEVNLLDHSIITSNSFLEKLGWTMPDRLPELKEEYFAKTWHTDEENLSKLRRSTREMLEKKEPVSVTVQLESKLDGRSVWCEVFQYPILSTDGGVISVIGLIRNVDEQIKERERLIEQAQRDPLTGLYNKEAFELMATDILTQMPDKNHALIFIDLDHFKSLNDTLGHMVGDRAICEAAEKLQVVFSNYDLISRFGGDEFCIFVKNIAAETLRGKLNWLVEKMHAEYRGEGGTVNVTCSCGVSCTGGNAADYGALIHEADKALYSAKELGRDRFIFFRDMPL